MAIAQIGASLLGGLFGASAAKQSAKAQLKAAELNNALARELYAKNEANASPYLQRGAAAGQALDGLLQENWLYDTPRSRSERPGALQRQGSAGQGARPDWSAAAYQESPAYAHQMERGLDAIASNKAMAGLLNSGSTLKSAMDFSQDLAAQDYHAWADRERDQFNQDRVFDEGQYRYDQDRMDRTFELDRGYADNAFESDRDYATDRHNQRLNAYFNLYGRGADAAAALAGAGRDYYSGVSANNSAAGQARADGFSGRADSLASAFNGVGGALKDAGFDNYVLEKLRWKKGPG